MLQSFYGVKVSDREKALTDLEVQATQYHNMCALTRQIAKDRTDCLQLDATNNRLVSSEYGLVAWMGRTVSSVKVTSPKECADQIKSVCEQAMSYVSSLFIAISNANVIPVRIWKHAENELQLTLAVCNGVTKLVKRRGGLEGETSDTDALRTLVLKGKLPEWEPSIRKKYSYLLSRLQSDWTLDVEKEIYIKGNSGDDVNIPLGEATVLGPSETKENCDYALNRYRQFSNLRVIALHNPQQTLTYVEDQIKADATGLLVCTYKTLKRTFQGLSNLETTVTHIQACVDTSFQDLLAKAQLLDSLQCKAPGILKTDIEMLSTGLDEALQGVPRMLKTYGDYYVPSSNCTTWLVDLKHHKLALAKLTSVKIDDLTELIEKTQERSKVLVETGEKIHPGLGKLSELASSCASMRDRASTAVKEILIRK